MALRGRNFSQLMKLVNNAVLLLLEMPCFTFTLTNIEGESQFFSLLKTILNLSYKYESIFHSAPGQRLLLDMHDELS